MIFSVIKHYYYAEHQISYIINYSTLGCQDSGGPLSWGEVYLFHSEPIKAGYLYVLILIGWVSVLS